MRSGSLLGARGAVAAVMLWAIGCGGGSPTRQVGEVGRGPYDTNASVDASAGQPSSTAAADSDVSAQPDCGVVRDQGPLSCEGAADSWYGARVTCELTSDRVVVRIEHFRARDIDTKPNQGAPEDMYTDEVSNTETTTYDRCGRRVSKTNESTSGTSDAQQFEYDTRGNVSRVTSSSLDGSRVWRIEEFGFDEADRMVRYAYDGDADGTPDRIETFGWSNNGLVVEKRADNDADGVFDFVCSMKGACSSPPALNGCAPECSKLDP